MGKVSVVGIGPGSYEDMTVRAVSAIRSSDVVVGYTVYAELVRKHFPEKEFRTTGMRREEERCRLALDLAASGKKVAMVCSGDAGVYGLASLILTMGSGRPDVEIEVIPGVTAALSGAAVLGAPLTHDFCVISLSDLMTPAEDIEKRIRAAAESDFVIVLYNPSSRKRPDYLKKACELCLQYRPADTVCAYVRNIGREGETARVLTLGGLKDAQTDMFTTVFIGNSHTEVRNGQMVTPRGYRAERTEEPEMRQMPANPAYGTSRRAGRTEKPETGTISADRDI